MASKEKTSTNRGKLVKILIAVTVFLVLWFIPSSLLGLPDISVIEHRVIAIFGFAFIMWVTEAIPSWTTSVLIVVMLLLTCSNSSISLFYNTAPGETLGTKIPYDSIMACFADPIILLFLGGFVLASTASKLGIDVQLARILFKPFGKRSEFVLLGFLLITGVFSMFISNTATAAMMLTFIAPVLKQLPEDGKGRISMALAIPIGANIGGIATPIGTPPNAIALKYLNDPEGLNMNIGFGEWVSVMMPYTLIMLFLAWILLIKLFPFKQKTIDLSIEGGAKKGKDTIIAYVTMIVTILLWMFDKLTGVNSNVVAMIPIAVFSVTGIFTKDDLKSINWSVLWLVAGGFALGVAVYKTGLANSRGNAIPFFTWPPVIIIIGAGVICWIVSNIISHTATATLLIPVMVAVGIGMQDLLAGFGGVRTLIISVTLASSLGMILPISTPPNALAFSTGFIKVRHMEITGIIIGVVGLILAYLMLITLGKTGLF